MTPHQKAARIAEIFSALPAFTASQMAEGFLLLSRGDEQLTLNALPDFNITPARVIGAYAAFYNALSELGLAALLQAPDLNVYQAQEDGSVLFVAPQDPEI